MLDFKLNELLICRMSYKMSYFALLEWKQNMFKTLYFFLIIRITDYIVKNLEKIKDEKANQTYL